MKRLAISQRYVAVLKDLLNHTKPPVFNKGELALFKDDAVSLAEMAESRWNDIIETLKTLLPTKKLLSIEDYEKHIRDSIKINFDKAGIPEAAIFTRDYFDILIKPFESIIQDLRSKKKLIRPPYNLHYKEPQLTSLDGDLRRRFFDHLAHDIDAEGTELGLAIDEVRYSRTMYDLHRISNAGVSLKLLQEYAETVITNPLSQSEFLMRAEEIFHSFADLGNNKLILNGANKFGYLISSSDYFELYWNQMSTINPELNSKPIIKEALKSSLAALSGSFNPDTDNSLDLIQEKVSKHVPGEKVKSWPSAELANELMRDFIHRSFSDALCEPYMRALRNNSNQWRER